MPLPRDTYYYDVFMLLHIWYIYIRYAMRRYIYIYICSLWALYTRRLRDIITPRHIFSVAFLAFSFISLYMAPSRHIYETYRDILIASSSLPPMHFLPRYTIISHIFHFIIIIFRDKILWYILLFLLWYMRFAIIYEHADILLSQRAAFIIIIIH